jgi:hypothetical protein
MKSFNVVNARGEREIFSYKKVYNSAIRSGASRNEAEKIAQTIKKEVYPEIKTLEIYNRIKELLKNESFRYSLRFSLREGMRKLGPTGFPFEKYVGRILEELNFKVGINQHLPGRCISEYEIDFIAEKENIIYLGECKYRNIFGDRVSSVDALINYARFLDIKEGSFFKAKKYSNYKIKSMMITNTKFTHTALSYLNCKNISAFGWKYPIKKGLEHIIEENKLYPITVLPSLKGRMKDVFVSKNLMLAKDVLEVDINKLSRMFNISKNQFNSLIKESKILLDKQD